MECFTIFQSVFAGLSKNKLFINSAIFPDVTSFYALKSHLMVTTLRSKLLFLNESAEIINDSERDIEMGSIIVCSSGNTVTLLHPRGNLETISPRILVLDAIISSLAKY